MDTNAVLSQIIAMAWVIAWAFIWVLVWHLRSRRKDRRLELIHKERLAAMEKGIPIPELPDYDPPAPPRPSWWSEMRVNPRWPLGVGALFIMLGGGVTVALMLSGEDYHRRVWSFGLIPIFFGVGLWLHYALTRPPRG